MVSALWNTRHERTTKVRVATIAKSWKIWQNHEESRTRDRVEIYCSRRWLVTSYHPHHQIPHIGHRPQLRWRGVTHVAIRRWWATSSNLHHNGKSDAAPPPRLRANTYTGKKRRAALSLPHLRRLQFVRRNRIWGLTSDISFLWGLLYPLGWMIEWQVWIIWMLRWTALWTMIIWFASAKNANHAKKRDLTDTSMRSPLSL